jgi:trehalose/maltose hydrolase-like predicted phosphorylase
MNEWKLIYEGWNPKNEPLREALCTLGNGYFATRGAGEESTADRVHYPGTYIAGGYNRLETHIAGKVIENEDLVNWPNWLSMTFRLGDGEWLDLDRLEVLQYRQELDLQKGILERRLRVRDSRGHETSLRSRRLVHMRHQHLAAIQWELTPENWSGRLRIRSGLDGSITNDGVARYRELNQNHLDVLEACAAGEDGLDLVVQSKQSKIRVGQAARTLVFKSNRAPASIQRELTNGSGFIAHEILLDCQKGESIRVEKVASLYTSKDFAVTEPRQEAQKAIRRAPSFDELLQTQIETWAELWKRCEIRLAGDSDAQKVLHLHLFHLLQTVCVNTIGLDVGVPSRGLHGEAYRGHIFWDELFIFPFLNLRIPELTRSLLMYRYRRLTEARHAAKEAGYEGALYPWQSGSNGREESQRLHLNPKSGHWIPDNSRLQRHVNTAIAFNIWQYYQATEDIEFLCFYGAEMMVEIARFLASTVTYNTQIDRYEIRGVMGPDEYHDSYPDAEDAGLDNNTYTNVMTAWTLHKAGRVLDMLAGACREELLQQLAVTDEEILRWQDISRKMLVPFIDGGIIAQFEGYGQLEELDWEGYRKKYENIQRLDRILEAEDDTPNRYKVAKQADVLMLFYLFSSEELQELSEHMGYEFDPESIPTTVEYYEQRCSHGSSLSRMVHSWVLARSDRARSWKLFLEALKGDISDIQGGTTPEGIHLGAMAGTVDIVQRCYTGIEIRDDVLWLNPMLPNALRELELRVRYRGKWFTLRIEYSKVTVSFEEGWSGAAKVGFRNAVHTFCQGETKVFYLPDQTNRDAAQGKVKFTKRSSS